MTEKARITKVQIGSESIEGIMLPNGDFGITVRQTSSLFLTIPENATRDFKSSVITPIDSGFFIVIIRE